MEKISTYDVLIAGYGPAGITAAIYGARKNLNILLVGDLPGGEVRNSGQIENWPGGGETEGNALADQMISHLKLHQDRVNIVADKVKRVTKKDQSFEFLTANGQSFSGKTVIWAAGRHPRLLGVPGEDDFKNRGVSYCATCDAPLFSGKDVAVIGGGNTGAEAVIMLQKIAKKIYLLHIGETLPADPILVENFAHDPRVEIMYQAKTLGISGNAMVNELSYADAAGTVKSIKVQGVFVAIGAIPNTDPVKELVKLDKFNAIPADRYGQTAVAGFFAAGDVTDIRDAQIVVAAGHGCSAVLSAGDYLSRHL